MEIKDELLIDLNKGIRFIGEELGEIKGKVSGIEARLTALPCADQEKRLRSVERKVWTISSVAGLAGAGLGWIVEHLKSFKL